MKKYVLKGWYENTIKNKIPIKNQVEFKNLVNKINDLDENRDIPIRDVINLLGKNFIIRNQCIIENNNLRTFSEIAQSHFIFHPSKPHYVEPNMYV